jgi:P27 family predicted phage terminase small subunit
MPRGRKPQTWVGLSESSAPQPASFEPGIPPCPVDMSGDARDEWDRISVELADAGALATTDLAILTLYCVTYATYRSLANEVERIGCVREVDVLDRLGSPTGAKLRKLDPAARHLELVAKRLQSLTAELGLTPRSRTRATQVGVAAEGGEE